MALENGMGGKQSGGASWPTGRFPSIPSRAERPHRTSREVDCHREGIGSQIGEYTLANGSSRWSGAESSGLSSNPRSSYFAPPMSRTLRRNNTLHRNQCGTGLRVDFLGGRDEAPGPNGQPSAHTVIGSSAFSIRSRASVMDEGSWFASSRHSYQQLDRPVLGQENDEGAQSPTGEALVTAPSSPYFPPSVFNDFDGEGQSVTPPALEQHPHPDEGQADEYTVAALSLGCPPQPGEEQAHENATAGPGLSRPPEPAPDGDSDGHEENNRSSVNFEYLHNRRTPGAWCD